MQLTMGFNEKNESHSYPIDHLRLNDLFIEPLFLSPRGIPRRVLNDETTALSVMRQSMKLGSSFLASALCNSQTIQ